MGEIVHLPEGLRYAESHEWASVEDDGSVRVGITDFAQDQLGDVVFVELPEAGQSLEKGEPFGEVESTKSVSEVYAPVTGTVAARNDALLDAPEAINTDPYGDGWFILITPGDGQNLDHLLDAAGYEATTE
jgi:glycine cleavage system H protein